MLALRCKKKLKRGSAKIMNFSKIALRDRGSLHVEIQLQRVFHRASKSGSTHEPWGCMEQISWSEQVTSIRCVLDPLRTRGC